MAKRVTFIVPPEMAPGVYRAGVGFFKPGQKMLWPDRIGGKVPRRLIPVDEAAYQVLAKDWPDLHAKGELAKPGTKVDEPPKDEEPKTVREMAEAETGDIIDKAEHFKKQRGRKRVSDA